MTDEERNEQEERSEEERDESEDSEDTSSESGDDTSSDSGDDSGDEGSGDDDSGDETTAEGDDDSSDDDSSDDEDSGDGDSEETTAESGDDSDDDSDDDEDSDDDSGKKVSDVMSSDPVAVEPGTSIEEAAQKMKEADAGAVLVVDGDELKGIVTDRDIAVDAVAEGEGDAKVEDVMSSDPATLSPDDDIETAIEAMRDKKVRRLPVVEDGKPVGVVSIGDLAAEADDSSVLGEMATSEANN
jgi:CBS domain-containing protein